jgi:hypothetical protein
MGMVLASGQDLHDTFEGAIVTLSAYLRGPCVFGLWSSRADCANTEEAANCVFKGGSSRGLLICRHFVDICMHECVRASLSLSPPPCVCACKCVCVCVRACYTCALPYY